MLFVRRVTLLLVVVALMGVFHPAVGAQAADPRPTAGAPAAFDAPIGERGGALNPNAACGDNYEIHPRMRWVLRNVETGKKRSFSWFNGYPGMRFPRLKVGTYGSFVVVKCGSNKVTRRDRFTIGQKTRKSTISRAEFNQVKVGMTLRQVRGIVGNRGVWPFTFDGVTGRTFHQMRFWAWSVIYFRNGRVSEKYWNVGHD